MLSAIRNQVQTVMEASRRILA